jgi:hypothetical protein
LIISSLTESGRVPPLEESRDARAQDLTRQHSFTDL